MAKAKKITAWGSPRSGHWISGTGGHGQIQIQRSKSGKYLLGTRPYTGDPVTLSQHGTLKEAKAAGEEFAQNLAAYHAERKNPMARKKKAKKKAARRKATPAQLRALKKARAARRKMLTAKKKRPTRKKTARRPSRAPTHPKARAALRKPRNPVSASTKAPLYVLKSGNRFFDGAGFTKFKKDAAMWKGLKRANVIAQRLADHIGKSVEIVGV